MYIPLFVVYISRLVPSKIYATSLTIGYSVTIGIGSICGNFFSGLIMEHFGAQVFAGVMSVLAVAGVAVFLIGMAGTGREETQEAGEKVSMK